MRFLRSLALVASFATVVSIGTLASARPVAAADPLGAELMRLTNLDRDALGKSTLAIDATLADLAGSRAFSCPSNGSMTVTGRAADMATRDYFAHTVKGCLKSDGSEWGSLDIMYTVFGYNTARGENIAWTGYSSSTTESYAIGCALGASSGCPGGTTDTITSVSHAERMFMNSSGHRANILGDYDRFGCGSGQSSDGSAYFACLFSKGGAATTTSATTTDTTRPRVTYQTGKGATYAYGYSRRFYATLSDAGGLRSAKVYLDGQRLMTWYWSTGPTSSRRSILISSSLLKRGTHTLIWHAYDRAGNGSTTLDGKTVLPAAARRRSVSRIATMPAGSSPLAGSSRSSSRGSERRVPAIPSRCFMPRE